MCPIRILAARVRRTAGRMALALCLLSLAIPAALWAQPVPGGTRGQTPPPPPPGRPQAPPPVRATRANPQSPRVDGRLDDPVWRTAVFISHFVQKDPLEGAPISEETEVAAVYDDDALYFGARMHCPRPKEHIRATTSRRDQVGNSERFIVTLDTYHDRRTAYSFAVTATGARADYYHPSDNEYDRDYSWDPVWEARTAIDSLGWTLEMRIPFSQLRFRNQADQVWGVNYNRYIPADAEDDFLAPVPKSVVGWSSWFPELTGIEGIRPSRRLEIVPYVAGAGAFDSRRDPDDPFNDGSRFDGRTGGDVKLGLGPNLTLDATVNPDFGQVEADPAEVNLTAFETFFEERRPFFTEGSQLLQGNGPGYFYSRRIGAAPHGEPPGLLTEPRAGGGADTLKADFSDTPSNTTILGAAKLTGRMNSGLSIGALTAVTGRERASLYDSGRHREGKALVEPVTSTSVLRVQQEFGRDASTVGLSFTGVQRDIEAGDPVSGLLNRQALAGGGDWNLRFRGGEYALSGCAGFSRIAGEPEAITAQQTSSRRYYQRPDVDYVHFDSTRTSLSGYTGSLSLEKRNGRHWLWGVAGSLESPGFELNDAGQLYAADEQAAFAYLTYRETNPGRIFRSYSATLEHTETWNFGGDRQLADLELSAGGQLRNFMSVNLVMEGQPRAQSATLTRGGPSAGLGRNFECACYVSSNYTSNLQWTHSASYGWNELGGWGVSFGGSFSARAGGRWVFSVAPSYTRERPVRQYITTLDRGAGGTATYGRRYVLSWMDRSTLAAQFRLNYAFTPDMTLEIYAEPFAASGRYFNFGELAAPRSRDLREYGTDGTTVVRNVDAGGNATYTVTDGADVFTIARPDFNVLSFRSNAVLRWEWRPGSTLFLVWQQNRAGYSPEGRLVGPGRVWDSLSADGENILMAKVTYWLPVK